MQIVHDFEITIEEYIEKNQDNYFPSKNACTNQNCNAHVPLYKHGFYKRNGLFNKTIRQLKKFTLEG